jgi:outer membrane protein OmpA-like peptidoglycan-associated protein
MRRNFAYLLLELGLTIATLGPLSPWAGATAAIPNADKPGSKDNPVLPRYQGSFIVAYEFKAFDEFTVPLSKLELVAGRKDDHNNSVFEPKQKQLLQGAYTRLVYLIPENRSPLEVLRNYQDEIQRKGGSMLFECKAAECGGDPGRSSSGGGGRMSLSMYLYPRDRVKDPSFSNGYCALTEHIDDQRYAVAEIPGASARVSLLVYTSKAGSGCNAFNSRTIAVVDVIESKAREQKMVTVRAEEMGQAISRTGRVALYGIYFDFNKTEIRPESEPTLEQVGKLLKNSPQLKLLVVGHTDNVGGFASNMDLSQRRAVAVVNALTTRFGVVHDRLMPVGVSFACPVAPNQNDDGRAKNRRVELVENLQVSRQ